MLTKIMSNATCPNCGTTLIAGAKFCRQCGRLVNSGANAPSVTEATTRTLRTPAEYGAQPTDFFSPQPTSPAYLAPGATPAPPAYTTSTLEPKGQPRTVWLLSLVAAFFVISLITLGIFLFAKGRHPATTQPPTTTVPGPPPVTIQPPPPPPAPPTIDAGPISSDLIYPGAETRMKMVQADGESFLQLHSKDSFEKVFDWYQARVKPENVIKPEPGNAILKGKGLSVIINEDGAGTNIMLQQGGEMGFDEEK